MELITDTIHRYRQLYQEDPEVIVTAPGRINLIGEHTDYNNGYVLPIAIDREIIIVAGPRNDEMLCLHSVDYQEDVRVPLSKNVFDERPMWPNYLKGVAYILQQSGHRLRGANICIRGNIPIAAGLSSSGALETATTIALNYINKLDLSLRDIISISQRAESEFVGVLCGIMDQYVSVMGKKNHALFLDCRSLQSEYIPLEQNVQVIVCDTGIRRELARSEYNQRRKECVNAVKELSLISDRIQSLRDVTLEDFQKYMDKLSAISRRRALHVITENQRVLHSLSVLKRGNVAELGKYMTESHMSLRDNYDVSCKELDVFVDIAVGTEGVFGARMTGAGFGGSAICLVAEDKIDDLVERLRIEYPKYAGRSLTIYLPSSSDGASVRFLKQSAEFVQLRELIQ